MARIPEPDDGVDDDVLAGLNETFYRARPHAYFERRLTFLALHAERPYETEALYADGLEFAGVRLGTASGGTPDRDDPEEIQRFHVVESEILLHHAAETLLRYYLAHEGWPPPKCPWIEISRIRDFAKFKSKVRERFVSLSLEEGQNRSSPVILGLAEAERRDPANASLWIAGRTNVEELLRHLARLFLGEAASYNAAKHGLALTGGEVAFSVHASAAEAKRILGKEGPALTYLETQREKGGSLAWYETTRWPNLELNFKLTTFAVLVMKQMWAIARHRYTSQHQGPLMVEPFDQPDVSQMVAPKEALSMDRIHWKLRRQ